MGGIGSGARRTTHIGNVEEMLALDIRALRRLGVVRAGECTCDTVHWTIGGLSASSARLRIDLSDIERGGVTAINADMPARIAQPKQRDPARFHAVLAHAKLPWLTCR